MKIWQTKEYKRNANRKWREENREQSNALRSGWRIRNPEKTMLAAAKRTAKRKGLPFNLTVDDIAIPERCPVLGLPMSRGDRMRTGNSPSLDRITPALGYVKGNVIVISWRANRIKADASVAELDMIASFYRRLEAN